VECQKGLDEVRLQIAVRPARRDPGDRTLGPHAWIGRSTVSVSVWAEMAREMCSTVLMANDPQDEVDVTVDDELSDEVLKGVSGGEDLSEEFTRIIAAASVRPPSI
jgi:hypothetical protein